jgi:hypothetical protein
MTHLHDPLDAALCCMPTVEIEAFRDTVRRWLTGYERQRLLDAIADVLRRREAA